MNMIFAYTSQKGDIYCKKCKAHIKPGVLIGSLERPTRSGSCFHLEWFTPKYPSPISIRRNLIIDSGTDQHYQQAERWVQQWNAQFTASDELIEARFLQKNVETVPSPRQRLWVEVFMFLTVRELELGAALSWRELYSCSRGEELWKRKYLEEQHPLVARTDTNYRKEYIRLSSYRCARCKRVLLFEEVNYHCPYYKRPICVQCKTVHDFKPIKLSQIRKIDQSLLLRFKVPIFSFGGARCSYRHLVAQYLGSYMKTRQASLITALEVSFARRVPTVIVRGLKAVDIQSLVERGIEKNYFERILIRYCGKDDRDESLNKSVKEFVHIVELGLSYGPSDFT